MPYCCGRGSSAGLRDFSAKGTLPSFAPDTILTQIHRDVNLRFDLPQKSAVGYVVTTIENTSPTLENISEELSRVVKLNAIGFFDVKVSLAPPFGEQKIHSSVQDLEWSYDGEVVTIILSQPLPPGEKVGLQVNYRIKEPITGMTFGPIDSPSPEYLCTDNETERARFWLPCTDVPSVRTPMSYTLTAPEDLTILANGALVSENNNGDGTKTAHWELKFPCPSYLLCIAVGKFDEVRDGKYGGGEIAYYGLKGSASNLKITFGRTPKMISWMENKIGTPMPWPKYYQVIVPGLGGAMENISLVAWDDFHLQDETYALERQLLSDDTNVHEMAHSYFGDALVCRHFEHSWLKESWATYMSGVYIHDNYTEDDFRYYMYRCRTRYFNEDAVYQRPIVTNVYNTSWSIFDAHLYPGGAWRLHMLSHILGQKTFWEGVQLYVKRFFGKTVETNDFRRALEDAAGGRNLTEFFDQWIYGVSYPRLKVTHRHDATKGHVVITVNQTQKFETTANKQPFNITLEVLVEDKTRGVTVYSTTFDNKGNATIIAPVTAAPLQIRVDPNYKLLIGLDFNPGETMLGYTLLHGDVPSRIFAGRKLVQIGTASAIKTVADALKEETYFGVRVELASALAGARQIPAVLALADAIVNEKSPQALAQVAAQGGQIRHPALRTALLSVLARPSLPYLGRAKTLEALASQRNPEDLSIILDVLSRAAPNTASFGGLVEIGAVNALPRLFPVLDRKDSEKVINLLKQLTVLNKAYRTIRPVAVSALAQCASYLGSDRPNLIVSFLVDCLLDIDLDVRMAASRGLATLKASAAARAVEAIKPTIAPQDHPMLNRVIGQIRDSNDKGSVDGLKSELAKLQAKLETPTPTVMKVVSTSAVPASVSDVPAEGKGNSGCEEKQKKSCCEKRSPCCSEKRKLYWQAGTLLFGLMIFNMLRPRVVVALQ